uniref:TIGR03943 family putative permease subunit n=1 Tax=Streptomyces sp. SS7 TaxID=3108485 RepID=UPI00403FEFA3
MIGDSTHDATALADLPAAAGGSLNPVVAALLHNISSIAVVGDSARLVNHTPHLPVSFRRPRFAPTARPARTPSARRGASARSSALPAGDPVYLTVAAFTSRAPYDSGRSLKGRTVRLTGFATHGDVGAWYVTRLLVSCCAADATTTKVRILGADRPATDTWVTVTGTWQPKGGLGSSAAWPPVLDAKTVRQVEAPSDPYEKR